MIFQSTEQIAKIIRENPAKDILNLARNNSAVLRKYVTGQGLTDDLNKLDYFEKKDLHDIKKKLAKSTRDFFERLLQPTGRVFTAKGGVRMYGIGQSEDARFDKILSNVRRGMSMKEWVQNVAFKASLLDPMSLLFTELDSNGRAYPTYKSTAHIFDYLCNGRQPEYVIFELRKEDISVLVQNKIISEPEPNAKYYRAVDDVREHIVKRIGEDFTLVKNYPHPFGKVPGIIASDIPVFDSVAYESALQPIMELAAEYFDDDASKKIYKKTQMYPREWSIELTCPACLGEKVHKGEDCVACQGTGQLMYIKQSQRISIALDGEGKPNAPIPPGGFYAPPIEGWDRITSELESLEQKATDTWWGPTKVRRTAGPNVKEGDTQTATGELINERSKEPRLRDLTKWAESVDKNQTDNIKKVYFPSVTAESTIKYGDRYMHGTIEELTEYYESIKGKGAPVSMLDRALLDIYESAFDSNPSELAKHKILMQVEPFVHNSISEVLGWSVAQVEKDKKAYYSEWLKTMNLLDILRLKVEGCRESLAEYVANNVVPAPPEEMKVA